MKNFEALHTNKDFNPCTRMILHICEKQGYATVRLRNGSMYHVIYEPFDVEDDRGGFFQEKDGWCRLWHNNGISFTTQDWDIIEVLNEEN